ncbi:MAG: response regulator [Defluviitaleaceae bacterium]|nr:response regulator [Defluviitaleaceae bacterium]MCL2262394.1 response regulator [Defluviitaleaceae bacterium]
MDNQRKTIFLVDDDITNLTIGKKALSGTYNVFTLNSAQGMFNMLENIAPDLILLDVNMPEMDGYQAIEILKANNYTAEIPVIFLTALSAEETELKGLSMGAVDYIAKPFSPPLLLKRLEIHLLVREQKHILVEQKRELILLNSHLEQIVDEKTTTVVTLKNAILSTMAELVEYRDAITGGHIVRTQQYIKVLMDAMKEHDVYKREVSLMDEDHVLLSCQLHDVGKISVSDAILNKPAKLDPEEFEIIKKHTTFGGKVIQRLIDKTSESDFLEYAKIFAVAHHEKWDGSGYPEGLAGETIPLLGRMMAIGDVYDALVETRPYKAAFNHEKATAIILEGRGTHFDPQLVDLFEKINPEFNRISEEIKG